MTTSPPTPAPDPRGADEWIQLLFDPASFDEQFEDVRTPDPLRFTDSRGYRDRIADARKATGRREAVWTGTAWIGGQRVVAAVSDFRFIGGSMGFAVGERLVEAMKEAREAKIPFIAVTCSGGARMQEGVIALFQMAKTVAAAQRLHEAGVPIIAVLANPTTGGVYASYATQADLIVAEAGSQIGFAGARVRAVRNEDGPNELHAADLFAAGQVDAILAANDIRAFLIRAVRLLEPAEAPEKDSIPPATSPRPGGSGWDAVQAARHPQRPRARQYIEAMCTDFIPIRGDRAGSDDPALVAGFGRIDETNVVCVAQDRTQNEGRVTPSGYRKGRRAMLIADRLQLPLITLVDTPAPATA